jgi:cardiolipin synthase
MTSARASGDRLPEWAGNTYIADIVKTGARVYLYQAGYLHAKTISIDSEICSIGSTNIDIRSFSINYEINAVLYDARLAAQLEAEFEKDLLGCTEFDVNEYQRRNPLVRFRDSVVRLFSPLL